LKGTELARVHVPLPSSDQLAQVADAVHWAKQSSGEEEAIAATRTSVPEGRADSGSTMNGSVKMKSTSAGGAAVFSTSSENATAGVAERFISPTQ
jgi:hypothetical protein